MHEQNLSTGCVNCNNELSKRQNFFCSAECRKEDRVNNHVRICKDCSRTPEEVEFGKHPKTIDGLSIVCKECNRLRVKKTMSNYSPEKRAEIAERVKSDLYRSTTLLREFGIDINFYNQLLTRQRGACAICETVFTDDNFPQVDHDHSTGMVRGLLCRTCNMGLGMFKDDPDKLYQSMQYLKRTSEPSHIAEVIQLLARKEGEKRLDMRHMRNAAPKTKSKEGRIRLLESQGWKCACCEDDLSHRNFLKINIDHDHKNMFIRGALCKHCNVGLGLFYEEESRFLSAIAYLAKHSSSELAA